jgi:hypothetical protein
MSAEHPTDTVTGVTITTMAKTKQFKAEKALKKLKARGASSWSPRTDDILVLFVHYSQFAELENVTSNS